ncbi:MAG: TonB-dependent receptor [Pseudomonadota bacterium]
MPRFNITSAVCLGAAVLCAEVCAQSDSNDAQRAKNNIEEIIVIGTKQGLTLQQLTDSVELMSDERLANEAVFNIADAVSRAANTTVRFNALTNISIRGISRNGTNNAGQGAAVNIYLDGVPSSSRAMGEGGQSIWDVQQLEVLRGSQSTVQGRNAIAGAVVVQSKLPSFEWEGGARILAAEYGTRQYAGVISGPLIESELAFRLSADYQDTDGYVDYAIDGEDADYRNSLSTRGSLLYRPAGLTELEAKVIMQYEEREVGQSPGRVSAPLGADDPGFLDFDPNSLETFRSVLRENDYETLRLTTDISYALSEATTLKFLGTYEDADSDGINGSRSTSSFGEVGSLFSGTTKTYTAELSLAFDFEQWTGLLGAYYFDETQDAFIGGSFIISENFPVSVEPVDSLARTEAFTDTETANMALFTQWRFEPNADWAFDVGLRYDTEDYEFQRSDTVASIQPPECIIILATPQPCDIAADGFNRPAEPLQSDDYDVWLPRAAATYRLSEDASVFASVRRGYRAGGAGLAINDQGETIVVTYDPEFLISYEAGWRSLWLDGRLTFNGTIFYSDYEDQQISVQDSREFSIVVNAGKTSLYGLELSSDYRVSETWAIYGTLGLLETDIDEFLFNAFTDPPVDLAGNELDGAPPVTFTVGISYERPQGVFGGISLNYRDASWSDVFNLGETELGDGISEEIDEAYLMNARLGYRYKGFTLTGFATNLLDEDAPESLNFADGGVLNGTGGFRATGEYNMRQPRTLGASIEYMF